MSITVIKLGGSLMRSNALLNWLDSIEKYSLDNNVVIVPGGGEFADQVRKIQKRVKFDEPTAHRLALLAMSQYGYLLAGLNPNFLIIDNIDKLLAQMGSRLPLVWLPVCLMDDFSEIPASWDFTSDSVALWLAQRLNAEQLILVKSLPVNTSERNITYLINNGYLDKGFQSLIGYFSGNILWFEQDQVDLLNEAGGFNEYSLEIH